MGRREIMEEMGIDVVKRGGETETDELQQRIEIMIHDTSHTTIEIHDRIQ